MQECFKCHTIKPLDDFYKHPQMTNGHVGKCKECNKTDVQNNYRAKKDKYAVYFKKREDTEKRKRWRSRKQREYRRNDPIRTRCRYTTTNGIRDGKLVKQSCEVCGSLKAEAHHKDYSEPFKVNWLCLKHHRELHLCSKQSS